MLQDYDEPTLSAKVICFLVLMAEQPNVARLQMTTRCTTPTCAGHGRLYRHLLEYVLADLKEALAEAPSQGSALSGQT